MHRKRTHGDRFRRLRALAGRTLLVAAVGLVGAGQVAQAQDCPPSPVPDPAVCSLDYVLPGDLPNLIPDCAENQDFMQFSWQTFLALNAPAVGGQIAVDGDNQTQWSGWSSTADLLNQRTPGASGSRYTPPACRLVPGHENYRSLDQVGKVDDSFLEAETGGLSSHPLIDANGKFLRYEILTSPALYNQVVAEKLYDAQTLAGLTQNINLVCGELDYTGGDPADPQAGAMVIKAAWMETGDLSESKKAGYHTETLLVHNPGYRNSTGTPTCELQEMALVGMHVVRKTTRQPNWLWATWEHVTNAPDCEAQMPFKQFSGPINETCPVTVSADYAFYSPACQADGESGACAACNIGPGSNATPDAPCTNPFDPDGPGWCLDLPAAESAGQSRLCRQAPVESSFCSNDPSTKCSSDADCPDQQAGSCAESYPTANDWNVACWNTIDAAGAGTSVWANYRLISTQWVTDTFDTCSNVQDYVLPPGQGVQSSIIALGVPMRPVDGETNIVTKPVLANSSMESYERANCTGCHSKTVLTGVCEYSPNIACDSKNDCSSLSICTDGACSGDPAQACSTQQDCANLTTCNQVTTDFMYWLQLEAAAPPAVLGGGGRFRLLQWSEEMSGNRKNRARIRFDDRLSFVPPEESANDPRCNGLPDGSVNAWIRVFDNERLVDSGLIELPCENWSRRGRNGYSYRDRTGVCQRVVISENRRITAYCRSTDLLDGFVSEGDEIDVVVRLGRVRYCNRFGAFSARSRSHSSRYTSSGPVEAPSECPTAVMTLGVFEELQ